MAFEGLRLPFSLAAPPAHASSLSPIVTLSSAILSLLSSGCLCPALGITKCLSFLLSQLSFHSLGRMRQTLVLSSVPCSGSAQLACQFPHFMQSQSSHFSCQSSNEVDPQHVLFFSFSFYTFPNSSGIPSPILSYPSIALGHIQMPSHFLPFT